MKTTKEKSCKDMGKTKKRRKLEFLTDESSEDESSKKTRKCKTAREDDSTLRTSSEDDSMSDATIRKSSKKNKHKDGKHFMKWLVLEKI